MNKINSSEHIDSMMGDDKINVAIIVFKIMEETFDNELVFASTKAHELIDYKPGDTCVNGLEHLFAVDREALRKIVIDIAEEGSFQDERQLVTFSGRRVSYLTNYFLFDYEGGYLLQMALEPITTENEKLVAGSGLINYNDLQFTSGIIALMTLKNHGLIKKIYGQETLTEVYKIMVEEVERVFYHRCELLLEGDTLAIYVKSSVEDLSEQFRQITDHIHETIFQQDINVLCDINIGISKWTDKLYTAVHQAKFTLDELSEKKFNILTYSEPSQDTFMEFTVRNDLPYALENDELDVCFQGIFDVVNKELYGFEVLVRWHHKKYGEIPPSDFIPIAEKSNLITKIDLWVVTEAIKRFTEADIPDKFKYRLNFNVSPQDLYMDSFVDEFIRVIEACDFPLENIILELTETLNLAPKRSSLEKIKSRGVMIALDDFGTGFASLSQIKNYQIDFLKIDISFVRDINIDYDNTLITSAILSMANSLGIGAIAEGVENEEQIKFLVNRKCQFVQGFKFHRPMVIEEVEALIQENKIQKIDYRLNDRYISKHSYVETFEYGDYILQPLSAEGIVVYPSDRLTQLLGLPIGSNSAMVEYIEQDLQEIFSMHLASVVESRSHRVFTTYLKGQLSHVPVLVTLEYQSEDDSVDMFIKDYSKREDDFIKVKQLYSRYDLIFNEMMVAIIVMDNDFIIEEWNHKATEIFGYTREEACGKSVLKLLVPKDEIQRMKLLGSKTVSGNITQNVNYNIKKDGQKVLCEWNNGNLSDDTGQVVGMVSMVSDVSEQVRRREEIKSLSTLITQEPSPILMTDLEGSIEYVNEAFIQLTGYSAEDVYGHNPNILNSGQQSIKFYEELWTQILDGQVWEGHMENRKKNGDVYLTESRIFPIVNDDGEIIKFACIEKDITQELKREKYIQEIDIALENQERLSMIGQMAAGIMHEINNPLSFIDINVHALNDMIADLISHPTDKEIVDELDDLVNDLKDGINSIKGIAAGLKRFTYKSQSNEKEYVDLNEEIATVITIGKNEYKYYADIFFEPGKIDMLMGDAGKIRQVLLNLLINAVHAIREKSEGKHGVLNITTYEDDGYIVCDVTDNGMGMPIEIQTHIFESFYTTKAEGKGTGLGLSLSKKIIEEDHEGHLSFNSTYGQGTTFTIKLPKFEEDNNGY